MTNPSFLEGPGVESLHEGWLYIPANTSSTNRQQLHKQHIKQGRKVVGELGRAVGKGIWKCDQSTLYYCTKLSNSKFKNEYKS